MANIYYQQDCDLNKLNGKTVAIIGYGSQGQRARAEPARLRRPGHRLASTTAARAGQRPSRRG